MARKPMPHPRLFYFKCPRCGYYHVAEETLRRFITEKLQRALDKSLKEGAERIVLTFKDGCPRCAGDRLNAEVQLSIQKPRLAH